MLRKIVADLNKEAKRTAYTEGAVLEFVKTLTRRRVPTGELQQALVARAEAARLAGRFDEADTLRGEAVQMARADARRLKEQFRASSRQAASVPASQASLALTRLDRDKGVRLLMEAFEERADDVRARSTVTLVTLKNKESVFITELARDHGLKIRDADGEENHGEVCPACQRGFLAQRQGRYGPFLGCSTFPKCDYARNLDAAPRRSAASPARSRRSASPS